MLHPQVLDYKESEAQAGEAEKSMPGSGYAGRLLKLASRQILNQQRAVIEEQKYHALFQMLSIILHEFNQPLTSLLGNIELMEFYQDKPDKLKENLNRINDAGKRMSVIIKKIQEVRNGAKISPPSPLDLPLSKRKVSVLACINTDDNFSKISTIFSRNNNIEVLRVCEEEAALAALEKGRGQVIIMDDEFLVLPGMSFLNHIKKHFDKIPMVFIAGENREILYFKAIQNGVESCLFENEIDSQTILAAIYNAMETAETRQQLNSAIHNMADVSVRCQLTGLFRERFFRDAVDREIIRAKRNEYSFSVCKVQIDDFNQVYDICGKDIADQLVVNLSEVLKRNLEESQILCRYEKGAFTFLLVEDIQQKFYHLREELEKILRNNVLSQFSISISMGTSHYRPSMSCSAIDLIKKAGEALQQNCDGREKNSVSITVSSGERRAALTGTG